jgi:hypothetical protein
LRVELPDFFGQPSVGNLAIPRLQRSSYSLPVVEAIDVERTITIIREGFSTARPEELAVPEMSPICVESTVCFHGVNITSRPAKSMD